MTQIESLICKVVKVTTCISCDGTFLWVKKSYTGDKEMLGECEQFFPELMKVPRMESKLRVVLFKIQFNAQVIFMAYILCSNLSYIITCTGGK
ncbi:putative formin, FH2 domain superfamily [Helianthus debilis subsp. tardiflorus]